MGLAFFVLFILIGSIIDLLIRYSRRNKKIVLNTITELPDVFDENTLIVPNGLYFDKTHTWTHMGKNGSVKIGISDFLQHITGPITNIKMKNLNENIKRGELIFTIIQKGKHLNIYAPISGTIKKQNNRLFTNSSLINTSPYYDGWIYTMEPENWLKEVQFMKMAEKANEWLENEFIRVKDFFSTYSKFKNPEYKHILQDGGEFVDNILVNMEPEVWEDFQANFIDTVQTKT